jgi:hypothetical protein
VNEGCKETDKGCKELNQAFEELEEDLPDRLSRALEWMRSPRSRRVRIPLAVLCIIGSFFWYLPVLGIELLPIGLLLLAQDVPFLREPVARFTLWLDAQWRKLKRWWRNWRREHLSHAHRH